MRLPRVRFTVRGMMIAVAFVGLYFAYVALLSQSGVMKNGSKIWLTGVEVSEVSLACPTTDLPPTPGSESQVAYAARIASWLTLPPAIVTLLGWLGVASVAALLIRPPDSELTAETHQVLRFHRGGERRDGTTSE
jgi:hypothetical protein